MFFSVEESEAHFLWSELLRDLMFKVSGVLNVTLKRLSRDSGGGKSPASSDVGSLSRASSVFTTKSVPKHGGAVPGGPAHDEAPVRVGAPFTHLVHAARRPHLAHAHLQLLLEVVS